MHQNWPLGADSGGVKVKMCYVKCPTSYNMHSLIGEMDGLDGWMNRRMMDGLAGWTYEWSMIGWVTLMT